jgi:predicted RNA-binding protein with PIN domain
LRSGYIEKTNKILNEQFLHDNVLFASNYRPEIKEIATSAPKVTRKVPVILDYEPEDTTQKPIRTHETLAKTSALQTAEKRVNSKVKTMSSILEQITETENENETNHVIHKGAYFIHAFEFSQEIQRWMYTKGLFSKLY